MDQKQAQYPAALTKREREVLSQVLQGSSNKEAARALYLSRRTVEFHLNQIYRKLNVRNRVQALLTVNALNTQRQQGSGQGESPSA